MQVSYATYEHLSESDMAHMVERREVLDPEHVLPETRYHFRCGFWTGYARKRRDDFPLQHCKECFKGGGNG